MFVTGIARVAMPILMAGLSEWLSIQVGMALPILAGLLATVATAVVLRLPVPEEA